MRIAEIGADALDTALSLLVEGFPRRRPDYWRRALAHLAERPAVPGFPRVGWTMEADGAAQGIILLLSAEIDGQVRANLSSWYVRPRHRPQGAFLYKKAIAARGACYLNLSPSEGVLPIVRAFGFRPYTGGQALIDARAAFRPSGGARARPVRRAADLPEALAPALGRHLAYGCGALLIEDAAGPMLALYRLKWLKRAVPVAQFVFGDPERLAAAAAPVMRHLAGRGIPGALLDLPEGAAPRGAVVLPARGLRYAKGAPPPAPGDLRETEIAVFGP